MYSCCDSFCKSLPRQANTDEAVLVTWGILQGGRKELIHMSRGNEESEEGCFEYRTHAARRGLPTSPMVDEGGGDAVSGQ